MRISLTSDLHLGISSARSIEQKLQLMKKEEPDIIVNAGDNCGTDIGHIATETLAPLFRKYFPTQPIFWTNGNHDYWHKSRELHTFQENLERINAALITEKINLIDTTGPITLDYKNMSGEPIHVIGVSGWYATPRPRTNDINFLPKNIEGDTHHYLLKMSEDRLFKQMDELDKVYKEGDSVIFMSHFPVINTGDDYKGAFEEFSWSESIGKIVQEKYKCKHFLNGHAHQRHAGPLRYEAGSDYYRPNFIVIEV